MGTKIHLEPTIKLLIAMASFVIIIAGMQAADSIINSFILALIITINITPILYWLINKRFPVWLALLLTILVVVIIGITLILFMGISISQLVQIVPNYEPKIAELKTSFIDFLTTKGIDISQLSSLNTLDPNSLIQTTIKFLKGIGNTLSTSILLLVIIAFMLIEVKGFKTKLTNAIQQKSSIINQLSQFNQDIKSYVFVTTWTGAITAIADFLIIWVTGIDLAILWGLLFFILNYIPAVGFLLAIIPPFLLALLKFGLNKALLVFFGCWIIDFIVDKGIKPRYMQESLDLSPLVIILSVIFWTWVLGPMGAILAVPVTLIIKKLILESFEETKFLAILMGSGSINSIEVEKKQPEIITEN